MVFKTILIKLHLHSINNSNNYLHLHILSQIIHRQTVFLQLLPLFHLLLFILQKIIFLFSICNISETKRKTLCQISYCLVIISALIFSKKEHKHSSDIFRCSMFCFVLFFLSISLFFLYKTVIGIHIYTILLCAIEQYLRRKKKTPDTQDIVWHLYKIKLSERMQRSLIFII